MLRAVNCEEIVFHRQPLALENLCVHAHNLFNPKGEVVVQPTHVVPFTADVVDLNSAHNLCCMSSCLLVFPVYIKCMLSQEKCLKNHC